MPDIAVIGGGVAGCYAAWRLSRAMPAHSVALFESSGRIGGRLWSVDVPDVPGVPAEMGGMYYSQQQPLVYDLVRRLGLPTDDVDSAQSLFYLRRHRLRLDDFSTPADAPYFLTDSESGKSPAQLLVAGMTAIAPGLTDFLPCKASDRPAMLAMLRATEFEGRALWQWGFRNALGRVLSSEALALIADGLGHRSVIGNGNAYDMILHMLADMSGPYLHIRDGFQTLPETLARQAGEAGAATHLEHRLTRIDATTDGVALQFETPGGPTLHRARRVICALPPAALRGIAVTRDGEGVPWPALLDSLSGVPASKFFLIYPEPWWQDIRDGPGHITPGKLRISNTSLPACACYYWGAAQYGDSGPALVLGAYADDACVDFWAGADPLDRLAPRPPSPFGPEEADLRVTPHMTALLNAELEAMHGMTLPAPTGGLYQNWTLLPFGGAYHAWHAGLKSWQAAERLAQPIDGLPLYLCNEAYSGMHGWVEGALENSELLLASCFDLGGSRVDTIQKVG